MGSLSYLIVSCILLQIISPSFQLQASVMEQFDSSEFSTTPETEISSNVTTESSSSDSTDLTSFATDEITDSNSNYTVTDFDDNNSTSNDDYNETSEIIKTKTIHPTNNESNSKDQGILANKTLDIGPIEHDQEPHMIILFGILIASTILVISFAAFKMCKRNKSSKKDSESITSDFKEVERRYTMERNELHKLNILDLKTRLKSVSIDPSIKAEEPESP